MTPQSADVPANPSHVDADAAAQQPFSKVLGGSIVGTVVEYYDFGIYGYMATVLAALFFSTGDPNAALLGTLAAFAVAFFLRIPGGILFGHIGDKFGRKRALSWTILLMCAATLGIGFLPTYATLGIWATSLLVLMRCLQGIAAGGELGGATAFVADPHPRRSVPHSHRAGELRRQRRITHCRSRGPAPEHDLHAGTDQCLGLAAPFLVSLPLAFIGIWIRSRMEDTPQFKELENDGEVAEVPIKELFASSRRRSSGSQACPRCSPAATTSRTSTHPSTCRPWGSTPRRSPSPRPASRW